MPVHEHWLRVSRKRPCPICAHTDWCAVATSGEVALCQRKSSPWRIGSAGWLHLLKERECSGVRTIAHPGRQAILSPSEQARIAAQARACFHAGGDAWWSQLAILLGPGITTEALHSLRVGRHPERVDVAAFPMGSVQHPTTGIRYRASNGTKWSETGGHEGLFLALAVPYAGAEMLVVSEGPTDTAALLSAGVIAVGRPNCSGGTTQLIEAVKSWRPQAVVIAANRDEPKTRPDGTTFLPGQDGARALRLALRPYVRTVSIALPDCGLKDWRQLVNRGATAGEIQAHLQDALSNTRGLIAPERTLS